jgi:hypothetical protein
MSDSIQKDDEMFNKLLTKQHPTLESFIDAQPKSNNVIDVDDAKMDEMLEIQTISGLRKELEYSSLEEKYEEKLLIEKLVTQLIGQRLEDINDDTFFLTKDDERC